MTLPDLAQLVEKGLLYWLAAVALIVFWRCMNGGIALSGMLANDTTDQSNSRPAPERVQLLFSFVFALVAYARLALAATQGHDAPQPTRLPDVPNELLVLFAGSHSIYLTGKLGRSIRKRRGNEP